MDLSEFISARYDEEEAAANAGARRVGMPWHAEPQPGTPGGLVIDELGLVGSTGGRYAAEHIVRHDPARVLREVATRRRILTEVVEQIDEMDSRIESEWGSGYRTTGESRLLLSLLAAPYSDHPDYRAEWAPES